MKQFVHPNQISVKGKFKIPTLNLHNDRRVEITAQSGSTGIIVLYERTVTHKSLKIEHQLQE